ncbi:MAG: hypothetical protein WBD58_21415 [Geitlerinemataceae cyanobacterium]
MSHSNPNFDLQTLKQGEKWDTLDLEFSFVTDETAKLYEQVIHNDPVKTGFVDNPTPTISPISDPTLQAYIGQVLAMYSSVIPITFSAITETVVERDLSPDFWNWGKDQILTKTTNSFIPSYNGQDELLRVGDFRFMFSTFPPVPPSTKFPKGAITFGQAQFPKSSLIDPPYRDSFQGDVWFNPNVYKKDFEPGTLAYETLIHEIGHALGLKHPFENPKLPPEEDHNTNTVMSYTRDGYAASLMPYDIQVLQSIYGVADYNSTNTEYFFHENVYYYSYYSEPENFEVFRGSKTQQLKQTLWDKGGEEDTLNLSSLSLFSFFDESYYIDMNPGGIVTTMSETRLSNYSQGTLIAFNTIIENLVGSPDKDHIIGNDASNEIKGNAENDTVYGGNGADTIEGGAGNDDIRGQANADILKGDDGNDSLYGGTEDDSSDSLYGGVGDDELHGELGGDYLEGGNDRDTLYGDAGSDHLKGDAGTDLLYGGDDNDTIEGGEDNDDLRGQAGSDVLFGNPGDDSLYGGSEDDSSDSLYGGTGNDDIRGELGNDYLEGGDNNDTVYGGEGADEILGGNDDDYIRGEEGQDTVYGGAGQDNITGGDGDDYIRGQFGDDLIFGDSGFGHDTIFGDEGNDSLYGRVGNDFMSGGDDRDLIFGEEGDDVLAGDAGEDSIFGGDGFDALSGGDDNDELFGENGEDRLSGDNGDDLLSGGAGFDTLNGNSGNDNLSGGSENDNLSGDAGDDIASGNSGDDTLSGGDGSDFLSGGTDQDFLIADIGNDTLSGDLGNDTVNYNPSPSSTVVNIDETRSYGDLTEPEGVNLIDPFTISPGTAIDGFGTQDVLRNQENIIGSNYSDTLIGNSQNNHIEAYSGDDLIDGGGGRDVLDGGDGTNTVIYGYDPSGVFVNLTNHEAKYGYGGYDNI